ncbi:MAG: hypothetical protein PVJ67_05975 [Candidatus Pacearchaeota archaeon]|jgi:hypothetical protein
MGMFNKLGDMLVGLYISFIDFLPPFFAKFFNFLFLVLLVVAYCIIIWKLYRFISKKNIIELNLNKYNTVEHPAITKILAAVFYFIEYMILMPFWVFVWFSIFTIFLVFLTENLAINTLLLISATIVAAIRMTAYYREGLSKDISKLLPFTLLSISILNPNFFNVERIISHLSSIPGLFSNISLYLVFIIILEIILRTFEFTFSLFNIDGEQEKQEEENKKENETSEE